MYPRRYYPGRYYPPRYYPAGSSVEYVSIDVLEGLENYWKSRPELVQAFWGGTIHNAEAPEGVRLPYATFMFISDSVQDTTGKTQVVNLTVQLTAHASTSEAALAAGRLIIKAYDKAVFNAEDGPIMHCLRTNGILAKASGRGPGGKDIWIRTLDYDVMYTRTVTA
jgi:hypothetical protein